jgi:hypothetical protein
MNQDEIDKMREWADNLEAELARGTTLNTDKPITEVASASSEPATPPVPLTSGVPVRMSVGDSRQFEIGWIRNDAALPGLLRAIADEIEREQYTTMPTRARWYVWHSHDGREQHVHSTAMDPPAEHADVHVVCCSGFAASSGERHDPLCDEGQVS